MKNNFNQFEYQTPFTNYACSIHEWPWHAGYRKQTHRGFASADTYTCRTELVRMMLNFFAIQRVMEVSRSEECIEGSVQFLIEVTSEATESVSL